jgi:hypothetical protein
MPAIMHLHTNHFFKYLSIYEMAAISGADVEWMLASMATVLLSI